MQFMKRHDIEIGRDCSRLRMARRDSVLLAVVLLALCVSGAPRAADLFLATYTPLKEPDCVTDVSKSFFAQDLGPLPIPDLPNDRFFLVARHMGQDAVAAAPTTNFSSIPDDYPWPPARGVKVTGLAVPDPAARWQRSRFPEATFDTASGFQLHCYDAGSFINTWTFPVQTIAGGGPHAIYGYDFDPLSFPRVFDRDPGTDFLLQASVEIPSFAAWADTSDQALYAPVGQVSLFAYFHDRFTDKPFALLLAIFDNRAGLDGTYHPTIAHDGSTPFASTPLNGETAYVTLSPYSSHYTGVPWTGLRFFRGHVTQANFRHAIDDINAYCAAHRDLPFCTDDPRLGAAFGVDPTEYELTDFGVLHEIFRGGPDGQISMGVHVFALGAWNAH